MTIAVKSVLLFFASLAVPFFIAVLIGVIAHLVGFTFDGVSFFRWASGFGAGLFTYWAVGREE